MRTIWLLIKFYILNVIMTNTGTVQSPTNSSSVNSLQNIIGERNINMDPPTYDKEWRSKFNRRQRRGRSPNPNLSKNPRSPTTWVRKIWNNRATPKKVINKQRKARPWILRRLARKLKLLTK